MFRMENIHVHHVGPVSLRVKEGDCIGISGPSGAGKSILFRALADLEPFSGSLSLNGVAHTALPAPQWRRQVAFLPAESQWWYSNVGAHFPSGFPAMEGAMLGFDVDVSAWSIHRLSSGEKQRLALLRVLANRPRVLLLDEPTANLDGQTARAAENLILRYIGEEMAGVLWISHDPEQLKRVCSTMHHLENGRLSFRGRVLR